jgi:hypothetical protein
MVVILSMRIDVMPEVRQYGSLFRETITGFLLRGNAAGLKLALAGSFRMTERLLKSKSQAVSQGARPLGMRSMLESM